MNQSFIVVKVVKVFEAILIKITDFRRSVTVDQSFKALVWKPDMYIWDLNGKEVDEDHHFIAK